MGKNVGSPIPLERSLCLDATWQRVPPHLARVTRTRVLKEDTGIVQPCVFFALVSPPLPSMR